MLLGRDLPRNLLNVLVSELGAGGADGASLSCDSSGPYDEAALLRRILGVRRLLIDGLCDGALPDGDGVRGTVGVKLRVSCGVSSTVRAAGKFDRNSAGKGIL